MNITIPSLMLKKVVWFVASFAITLLLLEGGVTIYTAIRGIELPLYEDFPDQPSSYGTFDASLGWALKPNYVDDEITVNQSGFRSTMDGEACLSKTSVLLLGDSMVFGYRVAQEHLFSEMLNREASDYCFINAGVVGYSTAQAYLVLKERLPQVQPHVVMLFYTQENDMWWNARPGSWNPYFSLEGQDLLYQAPTRKRALAWYRRTTLYRFLDHTLFHGRDAVYLAQKLDFAVRKANYDLRTRYPADFRELFVDNDSHWSPRGHRFIADLIKDDILPRMAQNSNSIFDFRISPSGGR